MNHRSFLQAWTRAGVVGLAVVFAGAAHALSVSDFSILMDRSVDLNTGVTVHDGMIGVNHDGGGNLWIGDGGTVNGVRVDGRFGWMDNLTVRGDVVANGKVSLGQNNEFQGSVDAGGRVEDGSGVSIGGDLTGGENVDLGSGTAVDGAIHAAGNVENWGAGPTVGGDVVAGGEVELTDTSGVAGQILDETTTPPGNPEAPQSYSPVALPDANSFSHGSQNVAVGTSDSLALAPGSYRNLEMYAGSTLNLSAGEYYLRQWEAWGARQVLNLDVSSGEINIYVDRGVDLGNLAVRLNGVDLDDVGTQQLADAAKVNLETHGNFTLYGSGSQWAGSIFAPDRNIDFSNSGTTVVGNLRAKNLYMGSDGEVYGLQSVGNPVVGAPEPQVLLHISLLALVAGVWHRR